MEDSKPLGSQPERMQPNNGIQRTALRAAADAEGVMPQADCDPVKLKNVEYLIDGNGEVTLGRVGPFRCTAIAADDDNRCLAMLVRGSNESLMQLLARLDAAIEGALERDIFIDEINS
jgi:hypothetical protein